MEKTSGRAVVMGCACVITSKLTCEQIENFRRYHPEALVMRGEDSSEVVFTMDIDDGPGSISREKAVYSRTKTPDGKATITVILDPEIEDKVETVRDKLGPALLLLEELERQMLEMVEPIQEEIAKLDGMISQL